jgi:hypothetical protein
VSPFEAHLRLGGVWLPSDAEGAARIGGVSQPFGPPAGGTVDEWFTFPTPPNPDWSDANTNVGIRFAVTISGEWIGNRVWRPPTLTAGQQVFGVDDDTGVTIIAPTAIPDATPGGDWVEQLFSAPLTINPGTNYIAGYHTSRYGFTRVIEGWTIPHRDVLGRGAVCVRRRRRQLPLDRIAEFPLQRVAGRTLPGMTNVRGDHGL